MGKLIRCDALNCKDPLVSPDSAYQVQIGKGTWGKDRVSATIDLCDKDFEKVKAIATLSFLPVKAFRSKE